MTEHLLASDWSNHSVPGYRDVLLESPDRPLHLTLEPEEDEFRPVVLARSPAADRLTSAHSPIESASP
ncbi:hypothetical protein [Streptomyces sp. S3(2020)]|uniref:hypothetical protein n=1 Tax=Streptomyces sp. S3(2020) TaxID=2732044 RepID=UPI001F0F70BC|nr:hypothetical protein [Streptomyces sp. S3(2020)]